mmetsp:Transcript_13895/g.32803  ORF Transcript_13895/g.32803 Transcript_13895/m.32803 type:complete len:235 (-) Transcript_13895:639-1343(-)
MRTSSSAPPAQGRLVRCPLCCGSANALFARGRPFRMHLRSAVHGIEEGAVMARLVELADKASEADGGGADPPGAAPPGGRDAEEGEPPWVAPARDGNLEALAALVDSGGLDPAADTDRHGSTALHFAAGAGQLEVCRYLVERCGVAPDQSCTTGRRDLRQALHWAARNGQLRVCHWLVARKGVDVNAVTRDGTNAFHWAVWQVRWKGSSQTQSLQSFDSLSLSLLLLEVWSDSN